MRFLRLRAGVGVTAMNSLDALQYLFTQGDRCAANIFLQLCHGRGTDDIAGEEGAGVDIGQCQLRGAQVVLPCQWLDVGSWSVLAEVLAADKRGNVSTAKHVELVDSHNNVVVCEDDKHLLALIGLQDTVVVHSPEATLVCHKSQAQAVKELVARLEQQGRDCL